MDVGLLGAVAQSPIKPLAQGEWFFNENLAAFVNRHDTYFPFIFQSMPNNDYPKKRVISCNEIATDIHTIQLSIN